MLSSRTKHLEKNLNQLNFTTSLKAFYLVIDVMNAKNGFTRHSGNHFYHHLVDVTQKLINYGFIDEDLLSAALLHDLVEDVPGYSIEWIQDHFNHNVAFMVDLVTKKPGINYKDTNELLTYLHSISLNYGASLIKCADRMHNFSTLTDATPEKIARYSTETENYYIPFIKTCRETYKEAESFFFEAKTQIESQLSLIKSHQKREDELLLNIKELENELLILKGKTK